MVNTLTRRIHGSIASALLAMSVLASAGSAQAAEVTLRLHHMLPPQASVPQYVLDVWADTVEEESDGRIKVQRFPSMQLGGKPPELIDQAIDGVADVIWTVVGYTPGRFPSTEVFELPFMMTNAEATSRAFWIMFEKHMQDTEFKDVKMIGTWVHGPGFLHTSKPVERMTDLEGMKIRGGSRIVNKLLEQFGATPVGMPVPAVAEGLSKGVIDGTTLPWEVTTALKVPELVENHTEFGEHALYTLTFIMAMNKQKYDSLPDDLKAVIDANSGLEFSATAGRVMQEHDAPARDLAAERGNNIIALSEEQVAAWQAASQPVIDEWIADMDARGIDGQALVDEAKALIDKYTAE
ncbi:MAG: C4-dicarboxylate ABC transporter [Gammaproteobacteria bacterium]|nr:MAG: C4-dicarboxylate ABC transporter [Gammaproteobacteria bacterium]